MLPCLQRVERQRTEKNFKKKPQNNMMNRKLVGRWDIGLAAA